MLAEGTRPSGSGTRVVLGGTPADLMTRAQFDRLVDDALAGVRPPVLLASANLDHVHHFGPTGRYAGFFTDHAHHVDQWVVALDGSPLVTAARRVTGTPWPALTGAELLPELLSLAERRGARAGVLGGTAGAQHKLRQLAADRWPALELAGTWLAGPAELGDPHARRRLADQVHDAGVDVLAVCLGKPRQELWLDEFATVTGIRVGACFGGALHALVGESQRAPTTVQRLRAEWLWRLASEPRRLWRRYLVQGPPAYLQLRRNSGSMATGDGR